MLDALRLFNNDIEIISERMTEVCPFFHAALTLKNKDQFQLGKICLTQRNAFNFQILAKTIVNKYYLKDYFF